MAKVLDDLRACGFAELALVVLREEGPAPRPSLLDSLRGRWRFGLYNRYQRSDYRRHRLDPDAFEEVDWKARLEGVPVLRVRPLGTRFVDRLDAKDVEAIRGADLDVLFRFGFRILKGDVLRSARYGVWSFHHGDNREYRGAPPAFWEIYERNPRCGSILQVLGEKLDGGRVLYRSRSATQPASLYRTRNALYWKTAEFALRRLRDLHQRGWPYLQSLDTFTEPDTYRRGIYRTPGPGPMLRFLVRQGVERAAGRARSLFHPARVQWFLALRRREPGCGPAEGLDRYQLVLPPADRFYADPFLLHRDGADWLFFEDYRFAEEKGIISCVRLDESGRPAEPVAALARPYHLSYPFLFEWEGAVYMMPETKASGTIELYRAERFPDLWTLDRVLMSDVRAVDGTLLAHDGRFWLFTNMSRPGYSADDELYVFFADTPFGPWRPHPGNPVVSDVCTARPGGALFRHEGRLLRPGQDCSLRYGGALNFNEVETLTETDYRERPVARVEPGWAAGNLGTHTYARSLRFEAIDGHRLLRRTRSWAETARRLGQAGARRRGPA
jgi:hypothetical protein